MPRDGRCRPLLRPRRMPCAAARRPLRLGGDGGMCNSTGRRTLCAGREAGRTGSPRSCPLAGQAPGTVGLVRHVGQGKGSEAQCPEEKPRPASLQVGLNGGRKALVSPHRSPQSWERPRPRPRPSNTSLALCLLLCSSCLCPSWLFLAVRLTSAPSRTSWPHACPLQPSWGCPYPGHGHLSPRGL